MFHILSSENIKKINKLFRMKWELTWVNESYVNPDELFYKILNETPGVVYVLAHGGPAGVCLSNPHSCRNDIKPWIYTDACKRKRIYDYEYYFGCPIALNEFYPRKTRTSINFLTCYSCVIGKTLVDNKFINEVKCYEKYFVFMANITKENPIEDFYSAITLMPPMSSFSNYMFFKSNNLYKAYEIEKMLYPYLIRYVSVKKPKLSLIHI